jgi:uncharacterized protein YutD
LSEKKQKILYLKKWTSDIKNSNEKRVKDLLKELLPNYRQLSWDEEKFTHFYADVLNSLPARYKQKNSIELNGRIKKDILIEAIVEKLDELATQ